MPTDTEIKLGHVVIHGTGMAEPRKQHGSVVHFSVEGDQEREITFQNPAVFGVPSTTLKPGDNELIVKAGGRTTYSIKPSGPGGGGNEIVVP